MGYSHDLKRQEWYNQRRLHTHYFHTFAWDVFQGHAYWYGLTTDPYLDVYELKFMHMEQAGIVAMMVGQWDSFKPMEPDVLEPLKIEHFYITMIGIVVGIFLAFIAFSVEKFISTKCVNK